MADEMDFQQRLVRALLEPRSYSHAVEKVVHIETHISHLLLAGGYAYKIKKPLDLGFLDYRGRDRRLHFCREELRLNARTAPGIYLDVVSICGDPDRPRIEPLIEPGIEPGEATQSLEYAVRMRRFSEGDVLSVRWRGSDPDPKILDALAEQVAALHRSAAVAAPDTPWGSPEAVRQPVRDNFSALAGQCEPERLQPLRDWAEAQADRLAGRFAQRRADGYIRECHGDLHLGNIVLWEGRPCPFDGIEFNEGLRWIDPVNDVAFLMMDLESRGYHAAAWQLINRYLEFSGDYPGMALLDYYRGYRAMVRAKVTGIRLRQAGLDPAEQERTALELETYLALAESYTRQPRPCLLLTSGLSGSGKTRVSGMLLRHMGLVRLRSDVERKRLYGLGPLERSESAIGAGIYTAEAGRRTYRQLRELAADLLSAGRAVIVDATFLASADRQEFLDMARELEVPAAVVRCEAPEAVLMQRVGRRSLSGKDASEAGTAVLQAQLDQWEPMDRLEQPHTLVLDTSVEVDATVLARRVEALLGPTFGKE